MCWQGDSDNYYDPSNSLLPYVLATRKGIPISLAILHAAVGRRAGLPIQFVGMPMHFVNKMGASDSPDERFIDVFAGGRVLDRSLLDILLCTQLCGAATRACSAKLYAKV